MDDDRGTVNEDCFIPHKLGKVVKSFRNGEDGFMGATHALSAVAGFLALVAFAPSVVTHIAGKESLVLLFAMSINIVGGSLNNDLDNSASTAESSLGVLGGLLSTIYRGTSEMVQTMVRTGKDDKEPNPHRGLYHTIPGVLIVTGLVALAMLIPGSIKLPHFGTHVGWGWLVGFLVTWMNLLMAVTGLFKSSVRSIKKSGPFGDLIFAALCFVATIAIFGNFLSMKHFFWVPICMGVGMIIHIIGDMFTTFGNPTLFPIPYKGKMWWRFRILPIHAGGVIENWVFIPFFGIVSLVSLAYIAWGVF